MTGFVTEVLAGVDWAGWDENKELEAGRRCKCWQMIPQMRPASQMAAEWKIWLTRERMRGELVIFNWGVQPT